MRPISSQRFSSRFVDALVADEETGVQTRQVVGAHYSLIAPQPVPRPKLLHWSNGLAAQFGLSRPDPRNECLEILAGNRLGVNSRPYAACYGGHQFGVWAGQLGDGRVIALGELPDTHGKLWEFQLKGAGVTPYSRRGDGRAVLRSSLREYVVSESMAALGVPTSRALSLVQTGDKVIRDMFYDGNPEEEEGAIVMRVAPTFLRFGNFEIFASRHDQKNLEKLVEFLLSNFFPEFSGTLEERTCRYFEEICERTAFLMSEWMRVGFTHGVMNTDNMSALGLTIDYGPFGFLDAFDPMFTPNTTDFREYRYAYQKQPAVALWNLERFAQALFPIIKNEDFFVRALQSYQRSFQKHARRMIQGKFGIFAEEYFVSQTASSDELIGKLDNVEALNNLVNLYLELEEIFKLGKMDATLFWRALYQFRKKLVFEINPDEIERMVDFCYDKTKTDVVRERLKDFFKKYLIQIAQTKLSPQHSLEKMRLANPVYLPRNYLLQTAIDKLSQGDETYLSELFNVLLDPYQEQEGAEAFSVMRPAWAENKAGCSSLSCSS